MVHTFKINNRYYVFDSESGSLFESGKLANSYIKRASRAPLPALHASNDVELEIQNEIQGLISKGLLFKKEEKAALIKSKDIKALCLHICHDCNLSCGYCFAGKGTYNKNAEYMSFETAKTAVDFLFKNSGSRKILEIDFFGGEPLLNLDTVKKTVAYAREKEKEFNKKVLFTLTTNALLLNNETAKFLNDEMENVVLSLDGRKSVNDGIRKTKSGAGSYDIILKNIKNFVALRGDKNYYIRGTFTAENLDFSKDVLSLYENGFKNISLEPVVTDEKSAYYIGKDKLPQIKKEYQRLAGHCLNNKDINFFHFNIDLEGGPCVNKRLNACGAGNEYFSVAPSGDIYPCHQFVSNEAYKMGSVFEGKINEDIRNIFKNSSLYTKKKCGKCFAKYHCSGGCAANNIKFSGDINTPYEITCGMMKARMECALYLYDRRH